MVIPISALQHYAYCPRQCALIHTEQSYRENVYTERGNRVHEHVDQPGHERVEGVHVERALPLHAPELGLVGRADVVEFTVHGRPVPVEYKAGRRVPRRADDLQVGAQALALEEMFAMPVRHGWVMHHSSRRRRRVEVDEAFRVEVRRVIEQVRELLANRVLPPPVRDARCKACSLIDVCLPEALTAGATRHDATFVPSTDPEA
jgi:CRISPR-associated exonuclease Cas4